MKSGHPKIATDLEYVWPLASSTYDQMYVIQVRCFILKTVKPQNDLFYDICYNIFGCIPTSTNKNKQRR